MKTAKVKLAFPSEKPVNFKIGEANIIIGQKVSVIDQAHADIIMKQYPGWIELVLPTPRKKKTTKEA